MSSNRFVTYEGNGEFLVTTLADERKFLELWFRDGGRSTMDYDRLIVGENEHGVGLKTRIQQM